MCSCVFINVIALTVHSYLFQMYYFELWATFGYLLFSSIFSTESRWCHSTHKLQHHFRALDPSSNSRFPGVQRWWQGWQQMTSCWKFYHIHYLLTCQDLYFYRRLLKLAWLQWIKTFYKKKNLSWFLRTVVATHLWVLLWLWSLLLLHSERKWKLYSSIAK